MSTKRVTIKHVAQAAGVSIATVSQILNGNSQNFSSSTVEKVLRAKEELHYEPDYFAQRMIKKKSRTIGVLVPDITNPFFNQLIRGIEGVLYQENYVTMLCNTDMDQERGNQALDEFRRRGVDGIIIAAETVSDQQAQEKRLAEQFPILSLDQKAAEQSLGDAVWTDDFTGGRLAAAYLKEHGHKRPVAILPKTAPENIRRRFEGFRSIYKDKCQVIYTELSKKGGQRAVSELLQLDTTAIFAINDEIAFGIYLGLAEAGKKIPEDYSVIGYDNVDMCEYVTPQLTTIAQPIVQLGQISAQFLLQRIQHPEREKEEMVLPVQLIERSSVK